MNTKMNTIIWHKIGDIVYTIEEEGLGFLIKKAQIVGVDIGWEEGEEKITYQKYFVKFIDHPDEGINSFKPEDIGNSYEEAIKIIGRLMGVRFFDVDKVRI